MNNDLKVYARGKSFNEGRYDLRSLELLISNHRKIIDRLVSVSLGYRQVNKKITDQIDYEVEIKEGSIELLIDFIFKNHEVLAAFATDGGYQLSKIIVQLFKDAIKLRELASKALEEGLVININITDSFNFLNNNNVNFDRSTGNIYINNPKIVWAATATKSAVDSLVSNVDGESIEYIDFSNNEQVFKITPDLKYILGRQREELPTTMEIVGRLDEIAFTSHKGIIISGHERFHVTWNDEIRPKMQQYADIESIIFKVRPVVDHKKLENETIGFHVLDCRKPQGEFHV